MANEYVAAGSPTLSDVGGFGRVVVVREFGTPGDPGGVVRGTSLERVIAGVGCAASQASR